MAFSLLFVDFTNGETFYHYKYWRFFSDTVQFTRLLNPDWSIRSSSLLGLNYDISLLPDQVAEAKRTEVTMLSSSQTPLCLT